MEKLNKTNKNNNPKIELRKMNNAVDKYCVYPHRVVQVSKLVWDNVPGSPINVEGFNIKTFNVTRKQAAKILNSIKHAGFRPQGDLFEAYDALKTIVKVLSQLNKDKKIKQTIKSFPHVLGKLLSRWDCFMAYLTTIFVTLSQPASLDVKAIILICLEMYKIVREFGDETFFAQAGDAFILGSLMEFLPSSLKNILRNISLLTSAKLMDDINMFSKLVGYVIDFIVCLISKCNFLGEYKDKLLDLLKLIPYGEKYTLMSDIKNIVHLRRINPGMMSVSENREKIRNLRKRVNECDDFRSLCSKSKFATNLLEDFHSLEKYLESYENSTRLEPSCFILEGKPGTMKSYVLGQLLSAMGGSKYIHATKTTTDGKDFWDTYDNQENVLFDDLGQQGISQYRMIINLISTVKFPLDCAAVDKKDTKFFNSKRVFATTNCFMHLNGITKADCISDVKALWRRGYVFYFNVRREHDKIEGSIEFHYFDQKKEKFICAFPPDIKVDQPSSFKVTFDTPRKYYLKWMRDIIVAVDDAKASQHQSSELSQEEKDWINNPTFHDCPMPPAEAQGGATSTPCTSAVEKYNEFEDDNDEYEQIFTFGYQCGRFARPECRVIEFCYILGIICKQLLRKGIEMMFQSIQSFGTHICEFFSNPTDYLNKNPALVVGCVAYFFWVCFVTIFTAVMTNFSKYEQQGFATFSNNVSVQVESTSSIVSLLERCVKKVKVHYNGGGGILVRGIVSGHCVVLPSHACESEGSVSIYKDFESDYRLFDHVHYKRVYNNFSEDTSVIMICPSVITPFKNLSHLFDKSRKSALWLVNDDIRVPVDNVKPSFTYSDPIVYKTKLGGIKNYEYSLDPDNVVTYTIEGSGMCGSPLVDPDSGVFGMHVAGKPGIVGSSIYWSSNTRSQIHLLLDEDRSNKLPFEVSSKTLEDFSGVKLNTDIQTSVMSKSNFAPSSLHGCYDIERMPANLSASGRHTVKDIGKKSFSPVADISTAELNFAKQVLDVILEDFEESTDYEVIRGNSLIAGINMESSNGFECEKTKTHYVNKELGTCETSFVRELNEIEEKIKVGEDVSRHFVNVETLKDELRDVEKKDKPRSFRVSTIHSQFLTKRYTMKMVENLLKTRKFHQIMVGVNPYREWDEMYTKLSTCSGVWAGDISSWDGKMPPQVQQLVIDVILTKYKGKNIDILKYLLHTIPYNLVSMLDDVYMTNHSMPSGNFLTAIFNSLVNKVYTAMWYYRNVKGPNVSSFFLEVVDYVYGDDKLNGLLTHREGLNAITMRDFFHSLGMKFTTASKQEVVAPFESLREVSFLKRKFAFHPLIGRVMCPLDKKTLHNTVMWMDTSKDTLQAMQGKLRSFQMEMFLHEDGESETQKLFELCEQRGQEIPLLTKNFLLNLFVNNLSYFDNYYGNY